MFTGIDKNHPLGGFNFFTGVVENRIDPKKLGRVQVRIHGIHTEEKQLDPSTGRGFLTENLPWAMPMMPVTSSSMDGIGETSSLLEGTHVVGFARDGRVMNDLIILGTLNGQPTEIPYTGDKEPKSQQEIGFQDPREKSEIDESPRKYNEINKRDEGYPPQKIPQGRYPQEKFLNEQSINRLARNEKLDDTLLEEKKTGKMRFSPTGGDSDDDKRIRQEGLPSISGDWDEKKSAYNAVYPYNNVKETESGHVMEFDDTPDNERIHLWHRYGNYFEWDSKGNTQNKIIGDNFTVVMKDNKLYIDGDCDISAKGDLNLLSSEGNVEIACLNGNLKITSGTLINITSPLTNFIGLVKVNGKRVLTT